MASLGRSRPTPPLVHPTESSYCCPCSETVSHSQSRELACERGLCLPCRGPGMAACCCEQSALDVRLRERDFMLWCSSWPGRFIYGALFNPEPVCVRIHDSQRAETHVCLCAHTDGNTYLPLDLVHPASKPGSASSAPPTFSSGCDWETQAASVYLPCGFFCPT